jgi:transglutaminase-like putative cysteine protease
MTSVLSDALRSTQIIDGNHERATAFARTHAGGMATAREQAVSLYYAVRNGIRYDPYTIDLSVEGMRAGTTLAAGRGWCVPKAVLLAACCRIPGIPAKLGFADGRNHLSTERLRKPMNTDIFFWHGYASILIQEKMVS